MINSTSKRVTDSFTLIYINDQLFALEIKKIELQIAQLHAIHKQSSSIQSEASHEDSKLTDFKKKARDLSTIVRLDRINNYKS